MISISGHGCLGVDSRVHRYEGIVHTSGTPRFPLLRRHNVHLKPNLYHDDAAIEEEISSGIANSFLHGILTTCYEEMAKAQPSGYNPSFNADTQLPEVLLVPHVLQTLSASPLITKLERVLT